MNHIKYLFTLALCLSCGIAFAQKRISGHVWSKADGPIVMANVVEKDANNRNISATQTDANGNFSMTIKNPNNKLQISYIGYTTKTLPIGAQTTFKIELMDRNTLKEATVSVTRKVKSNGLTIPEREISVAQQSLNMDEMAGLSFETAGEALQGQIAGLDIVQNSGNLGAGTTMRLRGTTSINGSSEPLIVVDGRILEDYSGQIDYDNLDDQEQFATLLQVSVDDIANIRVLKDAASTAQYGARGANGVLEIKTRRGRRGKTNVSFSYRFSGSWQPQGMRMLNGDDYKIMLKDAYYLPNREDVASNLPEIGGAEYRDTYPAYYGNYNRNTDWVKEVTQFGQAHNYGVSISGGGEKAMFRISGSYDHETGTIIKQSLDRFTSRLALDYFVSDRIKFVSDFALTYTKNNKNYGNNILELAYKVMPNMAVYRSEYREDEGIGRYINTGDYYIMPPNRNGSGAVQIQPNSGETSYYIAKDMYDLGNPVAKANLAFHRQSTYTISPSFSVEYKLLGKDSSEETTLDYTGDVYLNAYTQSDNTYFPAELKPDAHPVVNRTSDEEFKNLRFTTSHSLVLTPYFVNEDHSLQVLAKFEVISNNNTKQSIGSYGIGGGITDPTVPGWLESAWTSTSRGHEMNWIAAGHYAYKSKYIFDFTVRADGSTKFGSGNKWGYFPGVSGRWNISDEKFFKPLHNVVNMLALTASYGVNGNIGALSEGMIYNNYAPAGSYNGQDVWVPENLRLTTIKWERTKSWNVGARLALFNDLLDFDLQVYDKKTTDLINNNVRIPSSTGFSTLSSVNVGDMENQGWELIANTRWIKLFGKFSAKARFNFAQNINTVTRMDASVLASQNTTSYSYTSPVDDRNKGFVRRVQIGHALGGIYGFRYKGVYAFDYDHNGYFIDDSRNQLTSVLNPDPENKWWNAKDQGMTTPIVFDRDGNVVYDKNGEPLHMTLNYGGIGYVFQGGDAIYEDINYDGSIDEYDIVYLGSSNPKISGGFGIDFRYDRWELKTNFNFRMGNKIINLARMSAECMSRNYNQCTSVNHHWRYNGQQTEMPRPANANVATTYNSLISDRYVEPGDYLRFQYLQLAYNAKAEKLKRFGLSMLRVSASLNNLIFWSRYSGTDPDHSQNGWNPCFDGATTPRSRSFTFSLQFGF